MCDLSVTIYDIHKRAKSEKIDIETDDQAE